MKDRAIQVNDNALEGATVLDLKVAVRRDVFGKIESGLVIGHTLEQNKAFLLIGNTNDFKGNPTLGVGIEELTLSSQLLEYRHKIREQFSLDAMSITKLDLYDLKKVNIKAHYERN